MTASSKVRVRRSKRVMDAWLELEKYYPRYEPSTIRKLYVEVSKSGFKKPSETKEGSFMTCLINPYRGAQGPFKSSSQVDEIFGMKCFICSIFTQYGEFSLLVESAARVESF